MATHTTLPWTQAERLRKARLLAGMSVDEMAEAIGVSDRTIRNYESGAITPRPAALRLWAITTDVDPELLTSHSTWNRASDVLNAVRGTLKHVA